MRIQGPGSPRPRGVDSCALLAVAVVGRAVADLTGSHGRDAENFLMTRLREPDNLWGQLLGDLCPNPTKVLAAIERTKAARPVVGLAEAG